LPDASELYELLHDETAQRRVGQQIPKRDDG